MPLSRNNKVLILYSALPEDAPAEEQDVLRQAEAVRLALPRLKYDPVVGVFTLDMERVRKSIERTSPAFVFNLVESVEGKGRLIHLAPSLLDAMGVSYTGCSSEAQFATSGKVLAKKIMAGAGIPTPRGFTQRDLALGGLDIRGRFIIKSVWEHASLGISPDSVVEVSNAQALADAMAKRRKLLAGECFAEEFIEGREFNLSVLAGKNREPEVLPPAEIIFEDWNPAAPSIVDYNAKWNESSKEYHTTPRSFSFGPEDKSLVTRMEDLARQCWRAFSLNGYARVDFRVDMAGDPWVLEVNANPCIAPDSGFAAAARQAGLDFPTVVSRIVNDRVRR